MLPAGRSASGKHTRALNWTWPLRSVVPRWRRLETQTDGPSVKRDVTSRRTTDDRGESGEKEEAMGGMSLLRSVFSANVLTWSWSASKQTAEQFTGVSPQQTLLQASWCVSGTENRVSELDQ